MAFKTSPGHEDRFIIKAKISIPGNPVVKNNPVMNGNVRSENSITDYEK